MDPHDPYLSSRDWCVDCGRRADNVSALRTFFVGQGLVDPLCHGCAARRDEEADAAFDARRLAAEADLYFPENTQP